MDDVHDLRDLFGTDPNARQHTELAFKVPAKFGVLHPGDMGKNGGQIESCPRAGSEERRRDAKKRYNDFLIRASCSARYSAIRLRSVSARARESSGFKIAAVSRRSGLLSPGVVQNTTVDRVEAKIVDEAKHCCLGLRRIAGD